MSVVLQEEGVSSGLVEMPKADEGESSAKQGAINGESGNSGGNAKAEGVSAVAEDKQPEKSGIAGQDDTTGEHEGAPDNALDVGNVEYDEIFAANGTETPEEVEDYRVRDLRPVLEVEIHNDCIKMELVPPTNSSSDVDNTEQRGKVTEYYSDETIASVEIFWKKPNDSKTIMNYLLVNWDSNKLLRDVDLLRWQKQRPPRWTPCKLSFRCQWLKPIRRWILAHSQNPKKANNRWKETFVVSVITAPSLNPTYFCM